jgi:hypothetical protein
MSDISTNQTTPESSNKWVAEIAGQLMDRLVDKNMSITYDFQSLTIDVPKAEGPDGKHIGSVQWIINGKITITSEVHDNKETE